jgi:1-acyl-sn-glycerol-3-phosphate acyltransferase
MPDCGKLVIIAAPHTSNWDFVFGMTGAFALGLELHWMGKHTLFKPPLGGVMRWLGLVVTPEGTRSKVERWKTGFWHIARAAGVPILLGGLDYGRKRLVFGPLLEPGESLEEDMAMIQAHYRGMTPRHPKLF